jgi:hypothetical protein
MSGQNYSNHRRYVPAYHILLTFYLGISFAAPALNVFRHPANYRGHVSSILIALLFIGAMLLFWYCRLFPLKAQDRARRAEEAAIFYIKPKSIGQTIDYRSDCKLCALPAMTSGLS